jgi:uncharacterized protein YecT (DUF1311 family)
MDQPATPKNENRTTWILLAGFGALLAILLFFSLRNVVNEDRLEDGAATSLPDVEGSASGCSGNRIVAGLKSALFAEAAAARPTDAAVFQQIAAAAVARIENAALEGEDGEALQCSASVAIDLPPGIVSAGGRRNLMGNVDYAVAPAGGGVTVRNAAGLISALSALQRSDGAISQPLGSEPLAPPPSEAQPEPAIEPSEPLEPEAAPAPPSSARPSFNCGAARTRGERAVCSDPGLAALDRQMASQYQRAVSGSPADRQALLRRTRDRFLSFRDSCGSDACIADAYRGRMREISDIVAGRWQPPR